MVFCEGVDTVGGHALQKREGQEDINERNDGKEEKKTHRKRFHAFVYTPDMRVEVLLGPKPFFACGMCAAQRPIRGW